MSPTHLEVYGNVSSKPVLQFLKQAIISQARLRLGAKTVSLYEINYTSGNVCQYIKK